MKIIQLGYILGIVLIFSSCNQPSNQVDGQNDQQPLVVKVDLPAGKEIDPASQLPQAEALPLDAFFPLIDIESVSNCHSEKGYYDDYDNGKTIPLELVQQYRLYYLNIAPKFAMRYKETDPAVVVKGIARKPAGDKMLYFYCIGINLESEEAPNGRVVDSRILVLDSQNQVWDNYFLGGAVEEEEREGYSVCRKVEEVGGKLKMTLFDYPDSNPPSHLKMQEVEWRALKD